MGPPRCFSVAVLLAGLLLSLCACSGNDSPATTTPKRSASGTTSASSSSGPGSRIAQPHLPHGIPVAPDSSRVDIRVPTFSHSTNVTNPLFPVSHQASVVFVGHVDGQPFRTEVTLLPTTRIIDWGGQRIETLVSQYVAYLGGRLQEVAYDLYAQAADGSVWYFGEDVADLAHGDITSKEGTWLAGKDGPAQMIMPGPPRVGDVFRTENIPGVAFEQVTVKSVSEPLQGPLGPVVGMIGEELHEDGTTEDKQFAPGYGEFFTRDGPDVVDVLRTGRLFLGVPRCHERDRRVVRDRFVDELDRALLAHGERGHGVGKDHRLLERQDREDLGHDLLVWAHGFLDRAHASSVD